MENRWGCIRFVEIGSVGNGTGIRNHSDTDNLMVAPTKRLPVNSSIALSQTREALQRTFTATESIVVNTPAVRIPFSGYASEVIEVVPAVFDTVRQTLRGSFAQYIIPSPSGEWMEASPDAHNTYVKQVDAEHGGQVKRLIQLVKAWKYTQQVPISSFYLELRVTKYCEGKSNVSFTRDLRNIFKQLSDGDLADMRDPMGISGMVAACTSISKKEAALSKIDTAASRSDRALRATTAKKAHELWDLLFKYSLPAL